MSGNPLWFLTLVEAAHQKMHTQNTRSIEQDVTRAVTREVADRAQDGGVRAFG